MRHARHKRLTAFVLAFLIVVQSVAGVMAAARPMALDIFGNPLCIDNAVADAAPMHGNGKPLDCCLTGCCAAASAVAVAPESVSLAIVFAAAPAFKASDRDIVPGRPQRHDPGGPRGPPRLI